MIACLVLCYLQCLPRLYESIKHISFTVCCSCRGSSGIQYYMGTNTFFLFFHSVPSEGHKVFCSDHCIFQIHMYCKTGTYFATWFFVHDKQTSSQRKCRERLSNQASHRDNATHQGISISQGWMDGMNSVHRQPMCMNLLQIIMWTEELHRIPKFMSWNSAVHVLKSQSGLW